MTWLRRNTRRWLRGIAATLINGLASGAVLVIADPTTFNLGAGFGALAKTSGVFALMGLANYLKQYPLPDDTNTIVLSDRFTNTKDPS